MMGMTSFGACDGLVFCSPSEMIKKFFLLLPDWAGVMWWRGRGCYTVI